MNLKFLIFHLLFRFVADEANDCIWERDSKVFDYLDLTIDDPIPGYLAAMLKALRTNPCVVPEQHHSSSKEVELVAKIRADTQLITYLDHIRDEAETASPVAAIKQLEKQYLNFDWRNGPLGKWSLAVMRTWHIASKQNDPRRCTPISINVGPVRRQQNPWCTSMVAADLLGQGVGKYLSASDMVLQFNLATDRLDTALPFNQSLFTLTSTQSIVPVLDAGISRGVCLESRFRSGIVGSVHSTFIIKSFLEQSFAGKVDEATINAMHAVYPGLPKDNLLLNASYEANLLERIADKSCLRRVPLSGFRSSGHPYSGYSITTPEDKHS